MSVLHLGFSTIPFQQYGCSTLLYHRRLYSLFHWEMYLVPITTSCTVPALTRFYPCWAANTTCKVNRLTDISWSESAIASSKKFTCKRINSVCHRSIQLYKSFAYSLTNKLFQAMNLNYWVPFPLSYHENISYRWLRACLTASHEQR